MSEILASAVRGALVDLEFYGSVAVSDCGGKLLHYAGDPRMEAFTRSSAKPMQAFSVFESGAVDRFNLTGEEISLLCASHSGEDMHVSAVRSILGKAGAPESALQCGSHYPVYEPAASALIRAGLKPSAVHSNCSGKHAGMIITSVAYGEDYTGYIYLEHPVQQRILRNIAGICDYPANKFIISIDGCGVPTFAAPLLKFAQGMARVANPDTMDSKAHAAIAERIATEMNNHPEMMSGTGRSCAEIMRAAEGKLVLKGGADGYYICGVRGEGIGIAIKMMNSASEVPAMVLIETLRQLGFLTDRQLARLTPRFYNIIIKNNRGEQTGMIKPEFSLKKAA